MNIYCPGCGVKLPDDAWYDHCSEECAIKCTNKVVATNRSSTDLSDW